MKLFLSCLLIFVSAQVSAQTVTTIAKNPVIGDGLFVDTDGSIYTGSGGLVGKSTVGVVSPDGLVGQLPATFPGSIDVDRNGNDLLITTYDTNELIAWDTQTQKSRSLLAGLDGPAGISVVDGRIFVSEFGAPPTYSGHRVTILDANDYAVIDSIVDARLIRPQGITQVGNGRLLVSNSQAGRILVYNMESGSLSDFTMLGLNTVNMAYRNGLLFTANNRTHRLMMVDMEGRFATFAGDGNAGGQDGALSNATFSNPLGLAFSPDGRFMYVAQSSDGALRRIEMPDMPQSLRRVHEEAGIRHDDSTLFFPKGVEEVTFFSMGEDTINMSKMSVPAGGKIDRAMIPYADWSISFEVNGSVYGYRNPSARLDMLISIRR